TLGFFQDKDYSYSSTYLACLSGNFQSLQSVGIGSKVKTKGYLVTFIWFDKIDREIFLSLPGPLHLSLCNTFSELKIREAFSSCSTFICLPPGIRYAWYPFKGLNTCMLLQNMVCKIPKLGSFYVLSRCIIQGL